MLEGFQAGLSWLTILRKRDAFREAFCGFDPEVVAAFGLDDVQLLLGNPGIVRNRRKIEAAITNARVLTGLHASAGPEALDRIVWEHAEPAAARPGAVSEIPATTAGSEALAHTLRSAGFVFVGPTTMYALMQACGLVNDHILGCRAGDDIAAAGAAGHAR